MLKQVVLVFEQKKYSWYGVVFGHTTTEFSVLSSSTPFVLRSADPVGDSVGSGVLATWLSASGTV